jgi:hypothetical protein
MAKQLSKAQIEREAFTRANRADIQVKRALAMYGEGSDAWWRFFCLFCQRADAYHELKGQGRQRG